MNDRYRSVLIWEPEAGYSGTYLGAWQEKGETTEWNFAMVWRGLAVDKWDDATDAGAYPPVTHIAALPQLTLISPTGG